MDKIIDTIKYFNYKKLIFPLFVILIYVVGFIYFEDKINSINIIEKETVYIEKEDIPVVEEVVELDEIKYIFVDIKGAVKNPGVYKLEEGSRVIDAIKISNGLLKNANTLYINLSKVLNDSDVIKIYTNDEIKKMEEDSPNELPSIDNVTNDENKVENSLININTANKEELLSLNGIGESKANSIIEYRNTNGSFNRIEDIKNVSGISDTLYEKIKDFITV